MPYHKKLLTGIKKDPVQFLIKNIFALCVLTINYVWTVFLCLSYPVYSQQELDDLFFRPASMQYGNCILCWDMCISNILKYLGMDANI